MAWESQGKKIEENRFLEFVYEEIANNFPGLTVVEASGYWRYQKNQLASEPSKIVSVIVPKSHDVKDLAVSISSHFNQIFSQYAVSFTLENVEYTRVINDQEMNWKEFVDTKTAKDACGTWNDFYRKNLKPKLSREHCIQLFKKVKKEKSSYQLLSVEELKSLNMENAGLQRWGNGQKSAEEAYPSTDRPRGKKDIESVNYHLKTTELVSPVIVARVQLPNSQIKHIKLDGVHRLVAAAIRGSKVKVLFLDF